MNEQVRPFMSLAFNKLNAQIYTSRLCADQKIDLRNFA